MRRSWQLCIAMCLLAAGFTGCSSGGGNGDGTGPGTGGGGGGGANRQGGKRPTVAYVTNGIASFWVIGQKGAEAAGRDLDVDVTVRMPPDGVADQTRMVQELLTNGVDGIAISPIDPDNQGDLLAEIAANAFLVTQDADAPNSDRLCYIGVDNYSAGRMCGELVKEAMPDGGSVMLFVGRLEQLNARQRRQGLIDELLDRPSDPNAHNDPNDGEIKGEKYTILDTRTDQFDFAKAKSLAEDAITRYPDLGCMVGLFAYNPPQILAAVTEANKLGKIKIVAFDEDDQTLAGIVNGNVYGTVVQDPYMYGYESVRVLAALVRGDESVIPEDKYINIPARQIRADNVQEFWDRLKELVGDAPATAP